MTLQAFNHNLNCQYQVIFALSLFTISYTKLFFYAQQFGHSTKPRSFDDFPPLCSFPFLQVLSCLYHILWSFFSGSANDDYVNSQYTTLTLLLYICVFSYSPWFCKRETQHLGFIVCITIHMDLRDSWAVFFLFYSFLVVTFSAQDGMSCTYIQNSVIFISLFFLYGMLTRKLHAPNSWAIFFF